MNKCALLIPRPGMTSSMVTTGYRDALKQIGWRVFVGDPKNKFNCSEWINNHDISFIMTFSKYGIRQLPISLINTKKIAVSIEALPLNRDKKTIDGRNEFADLEEPTLIRSIENHIVTTKIEPHLWNDYMNLWTDKGIELIHVPCAGNLMRAKPSNMTILYDVGVVANIAHRHERFKKFLQPLLERLKMLGHTYQAFGDTFWQHTGLDYSGPLVGDIKKIADVYSSSLVCPNIHTESQIFHEAFLNERSFMISLCGGLQVSDNILAKKYLHNSCFVYPNNTDFINGVIDQINNPTLREKNTVDSVSHIAENHTYFNRLSLIFDVLTMRDSKLVSDKEGKRLSQKHCWEIETMLMAAERGISYGENIIQT